MYQKEKYKKINEIELEDKVIIKWFDIKIFNFDHFLFDYGGKYDSFGFGT